MGVAHWSAFRFLVMMKILGAGVCSEPRRCRFGSESEETSSKKACGIGIVSNEDSTFLYPSGVLIQ